MNNEAQKQEQPRSDHWQQLHAEEKGGHSQWCVPTQWGLPPPWPQQPPILHLQVLGRAHQ